MSAISLNKLTNHNQNHNFISNRNQDEYQHSIDNHHFETESTEKSDDSLIKNIFNDFKYKDEIRSKNDYKISHRGVYKFVPRHEDEIEINVGDRIYVFRQEDNTWYYGHNLNTNKDGYFPSIYVCDESHIQSNDCDKFKYSLMNKRKNQFELVFLGSIQVGKSKGNEVIFESIEKIKKISNVDNLKKFNCLFVVSDFGFRFFENYENNDIEILTESKTSYFFCLKNVTFYGNDETYFAFICKHPILSMFACHVFKAQNYFGIKSLMENIGQAFYKFYQNLIEMSQTLLE